MTEISDARKRSTPASAPLAAVDTTPVTAVTFRPVSWAATRSPAADGSPPSAVKGRQRVTPAGRQQPYRLWIPALGAFVLGGLLFAFSPLVRGPPHWAGPRVASGPPVATRPLTTHPLRPRREASESVVAGEIRSAGNESSAHQRFAQRRTHRAHHEPATMRRARLPGHPMARVAGRKPTVRDKELRQLLRQARARGLFVGDDPSFDRLHNWLRKRPSSTPGWATALRRLRIFVEDFAIDRPFVLRKLRHLRRCMDRVSLRDGADRAALVRAQQDIHALVLQDDLGAASHRLTTAIRQCRSSYR